MRIHRAGYRIIVLITFLVITILVVYSVLLPDYTILTTVLYTLGFVFIFMVIRFFRIPNRNLTEHKKAIYSAADGQVMAVEQVFEKEYFNDKRIQVSVFMSVLNVHVNFSPVSGQIVYAKHTPGRHYPAYTPKSSGLNEHNTIVIKTENGTEIMVRQIAGIMARRIISKKVKGDLVGQGEEIGIIKFGSRVDLFLPLKTNINVKPGDAARGKKTIIGTLEN